jgi:CBS domain-containing protein
MKVKEIMTKDVVSVQPNTKVSEVACLISEKNFRGVPVVENEIVVGMITENDFLTQDFAKVHIPSLIKIFNDLKIDKYLPQGKGELSSILSADASSIMTKKFIFVTPDTHVTELVKIFHDQQVNPIPVLDENKKLVGIVSKSDILNLIGRFREEEIDFLTEN